MATEKSRKSKQLQDDAKEFVMLAHKYNPKKHLASKEVPARKRSIYNWWVTPKIDGVRARFIEDKLYTRTGREFVVPDSYISRIKDIFGERQVDGELMHKSNSFQDTVSIVRTKNHPKMDGGWDDIVFHVFDEVNEDFSFYYRQEYLADIFQRKDSSDNYSIKLVPKIGEVTDEESVGRYLKNQMAMGYEGVMLRDPSSNYEFGRSHKLLKVKEFKDTEVEVTKHVPGEGKHSNRLGALICKYKHREVRVGTGFSDEERENPPPIGSKVTVRYFEETRDGVPRFPVFVTVRDYED